MFVRCNNFKNRWHESVVSAKNLKIKTCFNQPEKTEIFANSIVIKHVVGTLRQQGILLWIEAKKLCQNIKVLVCLMYGHTTCLITIEFYQEPSIAENLIQEVF